MRLRSVQPTAKTDGIKLARRVAETRMGHAEKRLADSSVTLADGLLLLGYLEIRESTGAFKRLLGRRVASSGVLQPGEGLNAKQSSGV